MGVHKTRFSLMAGVLHIQAKPLDGLDLSIPGWARVEGDLMRLIWLALFAALLAGCGSGGGSAGGATLLPGVTLVDISTQGGDATTVLNAVQFTLRLPAGVTLPVDPESGMVSAAALHTVAADLSGAFYQPATAGAQATVTLNVVSTVGFAVGDLATLSCTAAPGTSVSASGFSLDGFSAKDPNGVAIPGITARFAIRTQ